MLYTQSGLHIMPNLLAEQIDTLAAFAPTALPVISLYLNTQSDDHGRDHFASFIRKELHTRARTFAPQSAARASFVRDVDRIEKYLATELRPSTNGLALFACAGAENFFEAVQLNAPLERHEIYVDHQPHLYTLALVTKKFPRYAAVVADTDSARLFVFGLRSTISEDRVASTKMSRTQTAGWSQARYQRHMVRPERRVVLAGASPVRVSAGAPGSRLQPRGEIRPSRAECRKPLKERGANQRAATTGERCSHVILSAERCLGGPSRSYRGEGNRQHSGPERMLDLSGVAGGGTLGKSNAEQERPYLAA